MRAATPNRPGDTSHHQRKAVVIERGAARYRRATELNKFFGARAAFQRDRRSNGLFNCRPGPADGHGRDGRPGGQQCPDKRRALDLPLRVTSDISDALAQRPFNRVTSDKVRRQRGCAKFVRFGFR